MSLFAGPGSAQLLTFQVTQFPVDVQPVTIRIADFNRDGFPDAAVLCELSIVQPGRIGFSILLNKGDGTFHGPLKNFVSVDGGIPEDIAVIDLDQDRLPDVVLADNRGVLHTFQNRGGGNVGPSDRYTTVPGRPFLTERLQVADLNRDGIQDIVSSSVTFLGNPSGKFASPLAPPFPRQTAGPISIADLNGDGKPDWIGLKDDRPATGLSTTPYFALGNGDGTFAAPVQLAPSARVGSISVGDFNGDSKPDLLIYSNLNAVTTESVFFGNGNGTFQPPASTSVPLPLFVVDMDGDKKDDFITHGGSGLQVHLSRGDGTFQLAGTSVAGNNIRDAAAADVNRDGKLDILTANIFSGDMSVLLNTSPPQRVAAVLNGASFAANQVVAPGSIVTLFGVNLAPGATATVAGSIPLPTLLDNVSVKFDGVSAPLLFVSKSQINAQLPWSSTGTVDATVTVNGATSIPLRLTTGAAAPGVFSTQSGQAIAINADGSLAGAAGSIPGIATRPALVGDPLIILGTGLGAVTPAIANGAASTDALRTAVVTPQVLIGGVQAEVLFAGLSPQFVGVNQLNVVVPRVAPGVVALQIRAGGVTSTNDVKITVANK